MIDAGDIGEIIAVYEKHGWILRRVLLSPALKKRVSENIAHFIVGMKVIDSDMDAAWFSRPQKQGGVPWEIRHLSETPFALLENIDDESAEFEASLRSVESRLRETLLKSKSA